MEAGAWEVDEIELGRKYSVDAESDDKRYFVQLRLENREDAEELEALLNRAVREVTVTGG